MNVRLLWLGLAAIAISSCAPERPLSAEDVITASITAHGGDALDSSLIKFKFRDRRFQLERRDGLFRYERWFSDSTGAALHDVLQNDGLYREIDGERVELDSATYASAETGVNSVAYFALLPYPLQDPAVRAHMLGQTEIEGAPYYEVEVTFGADGGGRDYEDRFVYWIHRESFSMDYLAYYFHTGDTGSRFRKAVNQRRLGGFLFADYLNYTATDSLGMDAIQLYDSLFTAGSVEIVSEVVLEELEAERIPLDGD